ncbi:HPr family phosphocarrier protein [Anaerocolumna sp.]|uniref:HPr family phosphocarrier protein n=1 Tax=Anaerocolumna sp. TaxID=2041569 RepID=UPI0028ADE8F6|nr:HPr family phosphocarrier protein [Anaerocolumna sp.]
MVSKKVIVKNKSGLHARPASELAKTAMKCNSDVTIKVGERKVNPKSILNLMAAAIKCGTEITVECTGDTEKEDLSAIISSIENGLGE